MACMVGSLASWPDAARLSDWILADLLPGPGLYKRRLMVCSSAHGSGVPFWHVPFGLWMYGDGLTRLGHGLRGGITRVMA